MSLETLEDIVDTIEANEEEFIITTDSDDDYVVDIDTATEASMTDVVDETPVVAATTAEPKAPSKMDNAKEVYTKMKADGKVRKDIIKAFTDPEGSVLLTPAGAATYYAKLSKA